MKSKIWVQLGALAVVMVAGWPAQAEDDLDRTIRSLAAVREFQQVTVSPDGGHVAWVESLLGKDDAPSPNSAIYVSAVAHPWYRTALRQRLLVICPVISWTMDSSAFCYPAEYSRAEFVPESGGSGRVFP